MNLTKLIRFVIVLSLSGNFISVQDLYAIDDNFESYSNGQYPSSGGWYNLFSGKTAAVSTAYSYSGSKSFRLEGLYNWSRIDVVNVNTSAQMRYEVAVYVTDASRGAIVGFFDKQGNQGPSYNAIVFRNDGAIYTNGTNENNKFIQNYNANTWYRIKVELDFTNNSMAVYVNGSLKRSGISAKGASYCNKFGMATNNFSGGGTAVAYFDNVKVLDIIPPPPDIDVQPSSFNYGNVSTNDTSSTTFEVINLDVGALVVSSINITGSNSNQFNILSGGSPFTLQFLESHNIVVEFRPSSNGSKSAILRLISNDPDENPFNTPLSGTGIDPAENVSKPNRPSGPSSGKVGQSLAFSTGGSSSNLGHSVEYKFSWGDGNTSSWGSTNRSHSYSSSGSFNVKAKAWCKTHTNVVSSWSSSKSVSVSYCQLSISVTPSGSGSVSKSPDKSDYSWNESVQLTAQANSGYEFDNWSGALSGSTNPKSLTMNGDKSVTAHFKVEPEVVSAPNRPSGPSSGKVGQSLDFSTGGSSSNLGHSVEYKFSWGDGNTSSWGSANRSHSYSSSGSFNVKAKARCKTHTNVVSSWSSSKSVSVSYCQLSISVTPSGSGSVSKSPDKSDYSWNESVQLTAQANSGYEFDNWSGALAGGANPKSLTMDGDKSVTVHFKQIQESVSSPNLPSGPQSGKVGESLSFSTSGATSNLGHEVEYEFDWGDGNSSNWGSASGSYSYSSSGAYNVKVTARCKTHTSVVSSWSSHLSVSVSYCQLSISVTPAGSGSVSKSPDKSYFTWNETVQLTAHPNSGHEFDYWSGALSGSSTPKSLTMIGDKNVTANFKAAPHNSAPLRPTLVSLSGNSYTNNPTPILTWTTPSDTDGDSLHFKVEIAENNSFTNEISGSPFESKVGTNGFNPPPPLLQGSGTCSLTPSSPLSDGEYWWRVTAWDGQAYSEPSEAWKFTIDTGKPYTASHNPVKDATDVPINTNIVVHVKDPLSGVDMSTIAMKVNQVEVFPTISGDSRDVSLTYIPPDSFAYDDRVTVIVAASDVVGNEMNTDYYSFYTEKKPQDPAFMTISVQEHGLSEPFDVDIEVSEVQNLFGVSIVFNYPEQYLEYQSFVPGDFLGSDVASSAFPPSNGQLPIAITKKFGQSGSNGRGLFARISFKEKSGVATGTNVDLACTEISAIDPAGNTISITPRDTSYVTPFLTGMETHPNGSPKEFTLFPNYPNPFNPTTTISYALPKAGLVTLQVFDIKGQLVRRLLDAYQTAGVRNISWNGQNEMGQKVASGIYFYKVSFEDKALHQKMIFSK